MIFKKKIRGTRVYAVCGIKRGMGATHTALSIANYLAKIQKRKVIFYEKSLPSSMAQMYMSESELCGDTFAKTSGNITYIYNSYISVDELLDMGARDIVIDLGSKLDGSKEYLDKCDKVFVITGAAPWLRKQSDYFINFILKIIRSDMTQMEILSKALTATAKGDMLKRGYRGIYPLIHIPDPFDIKRENYKSIDRMVSI